MSSSNWSELVQHCQPVSNVSLVCRDGVVYTHKIVLASVSGFVKTLLSDIPTGDHVSVFMPDFSFREIECFLENILLRRQNNHHGLIEVFKSSENSVTEEIHVKCEFKKFNQEEVAIDCHSDYLASNFVDAGATSSNVCRGEVEFDSQIAQQLDTSNVKIEASEYFMTEQSPRDEESVMIKIKQKPKMNSSGGRKTQYPELSRRERKCIHNRKWKARNPETARQSNKAAKLRLKKKRDMVW